MEIKDQYQHTNVILAGDFNADLYKGFRDERAERILSWMASWAANAAAEDLTPREGMLVRGGRAPRHLD